MGRLKEIKTRNEREYVFTECKPKFDLVSSLESFARLFLYSFSIFYGFCFLSADDKLGHVVTII